MIDQIAPAEIRITYRKWDPVEKHNSSAMQENNAGKLKTELEITSTMSVWTLTLGDLALLDRFQITYTSKFPKFLKNWIFQSSSKEEQSG